MLSRTLCRLPTRSISLTRGVIVTLGPSLQSLRRMPLCPVSRHRRMLSTPPPQVTASDISMEKYHALSDATMDSLLESLEELLDSLANATYEVEYHSGVLTLVLGDKGTYVINKQPPNKQIWLSSPVSGPKRYDYSEADDNWLYSRDGRSIGELLNEEISAALNQDVQFDLDGVSARLVSGE
ncbi:hypothetical protein BD779DRAFT_1483518 [Infundibulicybe gibba]|nr:hypothetical protein BD779DRAFT_1483518 [Infundibulicybe gibba]